MESARRLYERTDEWIQGLSRVPYALFLGACVAAGSLAVGSLLGGEFVGGRAVTMGVVMFALECVFGKFRPDK